MQRNTTHSTPEHGRGPIPDALKFRDSRGRMWLVHERERERYNGQRVLMLVFESEGVVRCVTDFPADWHAMGPEALEHVSLRT